MPTDQFAEFLVSSTSQVEFGPRTAEVKYFARRLGELQVPSGRLAIGDPHTLSEGAEQRVELDVPGGVYAVWVRIAEIQLDPPDQRVFAALLRVTDDPIAWWEPAGEPFPVDSGIAAFADARVAEAVGEFGEQEWEALEQALLEQENEHDVDTWSWADLPAATGNLITFSAGIGDGEYPVYRGMTEDGRTAAVLIDFELFGEMEEMEEGAAG